MLSCVCLTHKELAIYKLADRCLQSETIALLFERKKQDDSSYMLRILAVILDFKISELNYKKLSN